MVLVAAKDIRPRGLMRDQAARGEVGGAVLVSSGGPTSADDGENVARGEDEVLLAAVLDLGAAVLAVDHLVADGHVEGDAVAVVVDATGTHAQDLALLGLLLGGVRDDQAGSRGLLGLEGLDNDPVLERLDVDRHDVDLHFLALRWWVMHVWRLRFRYAVAGVGPGRRRWHTRGESARSETSTLPDGVPEQVRPDRIGPWTSMPSGGC